MTDTGKMTIKAIDAFLSQVAPGKPALVTIGELAALDLYSPVTIIEFERDGDPVEDLAARFQCEVSGPYWGGPDVDEYYLFTKRKAA